MATTQASIRRLTSACLALLLVVALVPSGAFALREGTTTVERSDEDGDGKIDTYKIDWDGDGTVDEIWRDTNEDGTVDEVEYNTGGDATRSPRGHPGTWVGTLPTDGGGEATGVDWDGDGEIDEFWWDFDGDGRIDDTDIYKTESKILDNTKATRFRGVLVGVNNGLRWSEKDADDMEKALEGYPASWSGTDIEKLTGAAATPAAIEAAINAAKADSKPGDEFVFYFSGHGGGYDKDDGWSGGRLDTDGDEKAIEIPESEIGTFDGSKLATGAPGYVNADRYDLDGNGTEDTLVVKDEWGQVHVWRPNPNAPPPWVIAGSDVDGDGDVDADDGGVDISGDGDKNDKVAFDDTILVAGRAAITDDQLTQWLSGFPESVTVVVILDSCYSGSFIPDLQNGLKDKDGKPMRPGHLEVVAAAAADTCAWAYPISNGALTQGILNALVKVPGSETSGGHSTSKADDVGNEDDRTTTRELFAWAGPAAVTFMNTDNDGDGVRNEDASEHGILPGATGTGFTISTVPGAVPSEEIMHTEADEDGDIDVDEDPPAEADSFFDVYYDPEFGGDPTPTFLQVVSGDNEVSATGLQPGFGVVSDGPVAPGTDMVPGPTLEVSIKEVPTNREPAPTAGQGYKSHVYDLDLTEITIVSDFEEEIYTVKPVLEREPITGVLPFTNVFATICPVDPALPPGLPHRYDEFSHTWVPIPPTEIDVGTGAITFRVEHLSKFAILGPLPGRPLDTEPTGDPWRLGAVAEGDDVSLVWSNPTDPDFSQSVLLRSEAGYATAPVAGAGQTLVATTGNPMYVDSNLAAGIYYYTLFSRDHAGNYSGPATAWVKVGAASSTQIAGADRYSTAVLVSRQAFPTAGSLPQDPEGHRSVVAATGANWPDALGGSALAGALGGPILLVKPDALPAEVSTEIVRLGADRILLLGGAAAVSAPVAAALDAVSGIDEVERIGGADRYETAEKIAARAVGLTDDLTGTAFVVTGGNFPDALAGSPLAAGHVWPIYLSVPTAGLKDSTKARIAADGVTNALILGGTAAVPAAVETYLNGALSGDVTRLSGDDRYLTAAAVATHAVDEAGMRWDGAAIATGQNFPDALAGGVMQGFDGSVIVLTKTAELPEGTRRVLADNGYRIAEVRFLGGEAAVSAAVRAAVMAAVQWRHTGSPAA